MSAVTFNGFWYKFKCTIFAAQMLAGTIDPDVSGLDFILWQFQCQVAVEDFFVDARIRRWFQCFRHLFETKRKKKANGKISFWLIKWNYDAWAVWIVKCENFLFHLFLVVLLRWSYLLMKRNILFNWILPTTSNSNARRVRLHANVNFIYRNCYKIGRLALNWSYLASLNSSRTKF